MSASAATLARCLDLRHGVIGSIDRDAVTFSTRPLAHAFNQRNSYARGMRPLRAFDSFFLFWLVAAVVHVDDLRVVLRYVRHDRASVAIARVDRPEGLPQLAADVPALTPPLAARLVNRCVVLCDTAGDEIEVTLLAIDGRQVLYQDPRTGRMAMRDLHQFAVVRGAVHRIEYSAGSEAVWAAEPLYAPDGARVERTGYFYRAWCSCGGFAFDDVDRDSRRRAVAHHLATVGRPDHAAIAASRPDSG